MQFPPWRRQILLTSCSPPLPLSCHDASQPCRLAGLSRPPARRRAALWLRQPRWWRCTPACMPASRRLAGSLAARGVTANARLMIAGAESQRHLCLTLACARLGAMLLPLNWRLTITSCNTSSTTLNQPGCGMTMPRRAGRSVNGPTCAPLATLDDWLRHCTPPDIDRNPALAAVHLGHHRPAQGRLCCRNACWRPMLTNTALSGICPARTAAWRIAVFSYWRAECADPAALAARRLQRVAAAF